MYVAQMQGETSTSVRLFYQAQIFNQENGSPISQLLNFRDGSFLIVGGIQLIQLIIMTKLRQSS